MNNEKITDTSRGGTVKVRDSDTREFSREVYIHASDVKEVASWGYLISDDRPRRKGSTIIMKDGTRHQVQEEPSEVRRLVGIINPAPPGSSMKKVN